MSRTRLGLILLGAILLQATLVPYAGTATVRPNLPLLVIIALATRRGSYEAVLWGLAAGYAVDLFSAVPLGMSVFVYVLAGFIVGKIFESDVVLPLGLWLGASATGVLVAALAWSLLQSLGTLAPFGSLLLTQALPSAAYTWGIGLLWAISPLYRRKTGVHLD